MPCKVVLLNRGTAKHVAATKKVRMNLLFDFYGRLLTDKQQDLFVLYYQADLSLGEIAAQQDVTRQAVYDILKRSERTLEDLEAKLHLVEKYSRDRELVARLEAHLEQLQADVAALAGADARRADRMQHHVANVRQTLRTLTDMRQ